MNTSVNAVELPRYRCHKEVHALKIKSLAVIRKELNDPHFGHELVPNGAMIYPEDGGYVPFEVSQEYVHKHNPQVGGYYVVYKDGYESFSPAEAFEDGYTLIR